jgi:hypothetical protein
MLKNNAIFSPFSKNSEGQVLWQPAIASSRKQRIGFFVF